MILPHVDPNDYEKMGRVFTVKLTHEEIFLAQEDIPTFVVLDVLHYDKTDLRKQEFGKRFKLMQQNNKLHEDCDTLA